VRSQISLTAGPVLDKRPSFDSLVVATAIDEQFVLR
jgi:hypothetical protein